MVMFLTGYGEVFRLIGYVIAGVLVVAVVVLLVINNNKKKG